MRTLCPWGWGGAREKNGASSGDEITKMSAGRGAVISAGLGTPPRSSPETLGNQASAIFHGIDRSFDGLRPRKQTTPQETAVPNFSNSSGLLAVL